MAMVVRSRGCIYVRHTLRGLAVSCCVDNVPSLQEHIATKPLGFYSSRSLQYGGPFSSVRHYADTPAATMEEQDPLKRIFFNMMKKYKTIISELTKSKITLDPDDEKAVLEYKGLMDGIRKKVGVPSKIQRLSEMIDQEAKRTPDLKTFYKAIPNIRSRLGVTEEFEGDKMMVEAVEKVEKQLGRVLKRGDKDGTTLLRKEFEAINKALGVDPAKKKEYESLDDIEFSKAELTHMKKEVVETIETHKKRHGLEDIQVDIRALDHRNYL